LPELFLAPRGLLTILLFFTIPEGLIDSDVNFEGVFLYVIIICSIIMALILVNEKKKEGIDKSEDLEEDNELNQLFKSVAEGEEKAGFMDKNKL
jgi:hypothetical protein